MTIKKKIEVFSANCPTCREAVDLVRRLACASCEVSILDMNDADAAERAKALGVRSLPAVAVDGRLASCCSGKGLDEQALRAAGLGQP